MILFNIDRVCRDFCWCMAVADMPSGFQKTHRIIRFDFDQRLRCSFHENERAILKLHRIAIIQRRRLFKIEQEGSALVARERDTPAMPPLMIKAHAVDHFIGLDRWFPNNRSCTLHKIIPFH